MPRWSLCPGLYGRVDYYAETKIGFTCGEKLQTMYVSLKYGSKIEKLDKVTNLANNMVEKSYKLFMYRSKIEVSK
jgi:hypothetical protein